MRDLRTVGRPATITSDILQRRFIEHTLQLAIQAALDIASHIVSDEKLGEPSSNRDLAELLVRGGFLDAELGATLSRMIAFRNVLVHGYAQVDPAIVRDIVENRLDDLLRFVESIRRRIAPAPAAD